MSLEKSDHASGVLIFEGIRCAMGSEKNIVGIGRLVLNGIGLEWTPDPPKPDDPSQTNSRDTLSIMFSEFSVQGIQPLEGTSEHCLFIQRIPATSKEDLTSDSSAGAGVASSGGASSSSADTSSSISSSKRMFWFFLPAEPRLLPL